ncbi:MAG: zf-HC2 domain-containing protein [Proteobacteria bacterium]|nr:zf-HC2 domain-containing protein [Pseudomonadota bacterium]
MVLKKKSPDFQNRLRALFALSISTQAIDGEDCLSVDEMAALIDGGVTSQKRDSLLLHLDSCPSCYTQWLAAAAMGADHVQSSPLKKDGFFRKSKIGFGSAMAVAASLVLLVLFSVNHTSSVPVLINAQYKMALDYDLVTKKKVLAMDSGIDSDTSLFQGYGFSGSSNASPFALSFISGFETGRSILMNPGEILNKSEGLKNDYYWAGRWFALLSTVCESGTDIPDIYWESQQECIGLFKGIFSRQTNEESEAVLLSRSIDRIDSEIVQKKNGTCQLVLSELNFILEGFNQTR